MQLVNVVVLAAGIGLIAIAVLRGRPRLARYRFLRDQEANVARYEAWRGGTRDKRPSAAAVAIYNLRRDLVICVLLGAIGLGLLIAGFLPA